MTPRSALNPAIQAIDIVVDIDGRPVKAIIPREVIEASRELRQAISAIASGVFSPDDPNRYATLMGGLYDSDWFMVAADFDAYHTAQRAIDTRWEDQAAWRVSTIRNIANVGWFSSDRTIREYAKEIWGV